MARQEFPEPMTCQQVRRLLADLVAENLDAERQGRVQGHLLECEECSVVLAEQIDRALEQGILTKVEVPPLQIPMPVSQPQYPLGQGVVKAVLWDAVKRVSSMVRRADAATIEVAEELLANLERQLQGSLHLYQLTPAPGAGLGPIIGGGETIRVQHLNQVWESAGTESTVEIEKGPVVTTDGEFIFIVTSEVAHLTGKKLICRLELVEGQAIRFETAIQPAPSGTGWRAEFRAEGLPAAEADVSIPFDFISLYAVPRPQEP